jgi:hypothetical protein
MKLILCVLSVVVAAAGWFPSTSRGDSGLIGHWRLKGDCRDSSGLGNHGVNHGVDLEHGAFNGEGAYIEVPHSPSLNLGTGDFTISAWIYTPQNLDDIVGDVIDMYDPALRRGITLTVNSSAGGYLSQGTDRHVHFGIDNAKTTDFVDCGRPNLTSNYVSNSLTVFKGKLYAATTDAQDRKEWCHVYRYEGGRKWTDCGRVGQGRTTGVGPMIVHNGELYVATWTLDWTRNRNGNYDPGRVYRYLGGTQWEDCGQPSENTTLNSLASFKGKLYAGGGPQTWGVYVRGEDNRWSPSKIFPKRGPERCYPHAMCRHNGKLFVAYPTAYSFDGNAWNQVGDPVYAGKNPNLQTHSMTIYQGKLHAGTFPEAKVAAYQGGKSWQEVGRVGKDGSEVNSLVVYNGKLYGGSLPRAEVCRKDGGSDEWTSLKRFYAPEGWDPGEVVGAAREDYIAWCRATSLTVYDGKMFLSTGSCTSSILDAPADDIRGKVFSMEAGKVASYDDDLGPGWKHLAAVREAGLLKLYINGKLVAKSTPFDAAQYDLTTDQPLRIGFGQTEYFAGRMADVSMYKRAVGETELQELCARTPD